MDAGLWQWMTWLSPLYYLAVFEVQHHLVGILYIIPIIYATVIFKLQGSLIGSILLLICVVPLLTKVYVTLDSWLMNIILLLSPITIVIAIKIELELRRREKKIRVEKEKEYLAYLTKIMETQEQERRKLAEEIHDESVQTLLAIASYAESIEITDSDVAEIKNKASWIKEKTRDAVEDLRRISINLRPSVLDDMGLIPALKWLIENYNKVNGNHIHLTINNKFHKVFSKELEVNVFRIAQEALHNIEKHANATETLVKIDADTEYLQLMIRDNGKGFILPKNFGGLVGEGKLGLVGMNERTKSLGGILRILTVPEEGTVLSVKVPILIKERVPQMT